jgi:hypothetical protein
VASRRLLTSNRRGRDRDPPRPPSMVACLRSQWSVPGLLPPLLRRSPTLLTVLFLGAWRWSGTTAIALFRTWVWLPPLAFLLAAPTVRDEHRRSADRPSRTSLLDDRRLLAAETRSPRWRGDPPPEPRSLPTELSVTVGSLRARRFTLWAREMTVLDGANLQWARIVRRRDRPSPNLALGFGLLARVAAYRHPFRPGSSPRPASRR